MTRGERNKNPGNLRKVPYIPWLGLCFTQDDPDFWVFNEVRYGIRAMARNLKSYQKDGCVTIRQAINRWAPPSENDTAAYVGAVATECGVDADTPVDFAEIMQPLVTAIIRHENGGVIYSDSDIATGIALP